MSASSDSCGTVRELAENMADPDRNTRLVAKRALWRTIRHAGRPGADKEKAEVITALIDLLQPDRLIGLRREVLWMLSEIGGDESVDHVAAQLDDEALREDARMALERIPTDKAVAALKTALAAAPDTFKPNLAHSLRTRGVPVD